jgi:hypothetical protein
MIRLPILKDELAYLEKLLPELQKKPGLSQLASDMKVRIERIRQDIRALQEQAGKNSK